MISYSGEKDLIDRLLWAAIAQTKKPKAGAERRQTGLAD